MKQRIPPALLAFLLLVSPACRSERRADLARDAQLSLSAAIVRARTRCGSGTVVQAEIEREHGRVVCSMDVAQGTQVREIGFDADTGAVVEDALEHEDRSAVAAAAKVPLEQAVEAALAGSKSRAVVARLALLEGRPVALVTTSGPGGYELVAVDGVTGSVLSRSAAENEEEDEREDEEDGADERAERAAVPAAVAFVETFGEDARDLGPTGTNPYFVLEPGYTLELRGKERGEDVVVTITVLDQTKSVAGVETRVVEERETVGGEVEEVTRDYFAISSRTQNVYYFGEDVDEYEDGKVKGHAGAWLAGEKGARYGLILPAAPSVGYAYCQELAPGVGMDRARIVGLDRTFACPAGTFTDVLEVEETNPLEPGARETKLYARGVGLLQDGHLQLVRYGKGR